MNRSELIVVHDDKLNGPAVEYGLSTLLAVAGVRLKRFIPNTAVREIDPDAIVLSYGNARPECRTRRHVHIYASDFFDSNVYLKTASLPRAVTTWEGLPIFYSTSDSGVGPVTSEERSGHHYLDARFDIVASTFFLLTGYEEVVGGGPLDELGRFPSSSSILGRHNLLHRPLVNEYSELLKTWIYRVAPTFEFSERKFRGRDFAIAVTHDLDSIQKYPYIPKRRIADAVLKGNFRRAADTFRESAAIRWLRARDPYNNLDELIEWENRLGIRSSFYLLASNGPHDAKYTLPELDRQGFLKPIAEEGWEIGLHSGYSTYLDEEAFCRQLSAVNTFLGSPGRNGLTVLGGRQHFLNFRIPYTWRIWEKASMKYDSTLGFADHEGFRCGVCVPFRPFDLLENREIQLWEIPLTIMDCTLSLYRNLTPSQSEAVLQDLLAAVKRHRGVLVLLWHNTYFGIRNAGEYHNVLQGFLRTALEQGGYVGAPRDILG